VGVGVVLWVCVCVQISVYLMRFKTILRCGCVGVWVCGCVGVWVCGWMLVWVCTIILFCNSDSRRLSGVGGCVGVGVGRVYLCMRVWL